MLIPLKQAVENALYSCSVVYCNSTESDLYVYKYLQLHTIYIQIHKVYLSIYIQNTHLTL